MIRSFGKTPTRIRSRVGVKGASVMYSGHYENVGQIRQIWPDTFHSVKRKQR